MSNTSENIRFIAVLWLFATLMLSCGPASDNANNHNPQATDSAQSVVADSGAIVLLTKEQFKEAVIQLGNFEKKPLSKSLDLNGLVSIPPQSKISVSFPYGGFVRSIKVLEGDYVKKGSLLAILENPEYVDLQEHYLTSKSALEYAKKEYERQKELYEADVAAGKSYQKATSEYHSLQASVNAMAQKLRIMGISSDALTPASIRSQVNIYAPASGYITKIDVNQGKYMQAQQELLELNDTKNVHIDLTVYEKDAWLLKVGQKVLFTLEGDKDAQTATIDLIGKEVRPDRTVVVHALPTNRNKYYMPGTYVQANVSLDNTLSDVLPNEAVVRTGGKQFIFLKKQVNRDSSIEFQMMPVRAGAESNGYSSELVRHNRYC